MINWDEIVAIALNLAISAQETWEVGGKLVGVPFVRSPRLEAEVAGGTSHYLETEPTKTTWRP